MASLRVLSILFLVLFSVGPSDAFFHFFPRPIFYNPFRPHFTYAGNADVQTKSKSIGTQPAEIAMKNTGGQTVEAKAHRGGGGGHVGEVQTRWPGQWELFIENSGISAMHMILMPKINQVQIYDATIWRISQIKLPPGVPCHVFDPKTNAIDCWAHSVLIDVNTGARTPLRLETDTWCSSGGLSTNGTLVSTGGFRGGANTARYLRNCDTCDWVEYPTALATGRWYSTQATLPDGKFIVVGGRDAMNYEYIPEEGKNNAVLFDSPFLRETTDKTENNLYPFVYLNTDGNLFIFANDRSILLSPVTNKVIKEYPVLPGGARNYPGSGMSALLPIRLHPVNGAVIPADVIVCGGSSKEAYTLADTKKQYFDALQDCGRMTITSPKPRWKKEMMPMPRVMSDTLILPTGDILFINGVKKGCAGWGFGKDPVFTPVLYMPRRKIGNRFKELAATTIPRVYHSTAVVIPDGKVLVAGSNTNDGYVYQTEFPTELRVEKFSPPYLDPSLANLKPAIMAFATPQQVKYNQNFNVRIQLNQPDVSRKEVMITLLAPPFTTHSISMNQRMLILGLNGVVNNVGGAGVHDVQAVAPPSGNVAPPGYYLMFAVYKGVPSVGEWIQVVY